MREINTHHIHGVQSPRIFVVDDADRHAGGMHHKYAIVWGSLEPPFNGARLTSFEEATPRGKVWANWDPPFGSDARGETTTVGGCVISYQHGPVKEAGANGLFGECLRAVEIDRLDCANKGPFACRENSLAKTKLEESLMWGLERTRRRHRAGAEGRNIRVDGDYDATGKK